MLRDNPPAAQRDASSVSAINPYGMQAHVYDKTQPENIAYLQRVRAVLDEYQAVSIGEVGDDNALATMAAYTGADKLHMAYSFNSHAVFRRHIRSQVKIRRRQGRLASWSVGNPTRARHDAWGARIRRRRWPRWCGVRPR